MNRNFPKPSRIHLLNFFAGFFVLAGLASLIFGIIHGCKHWFYDEKVETAATASLHNLGMHLVHEIQRTVSPAIQRSRKLAANPEIIRALKSDDRKRLTELCNDAVCDSTEIDAVALFGANASILAINHVFTDGSPIPKDRVDRILEIDFEERPIISRCVSNESTEEVLEFQTHCDITPSFFDSTGLAIAHSVPIFAPETKLKIGVVSTRLRFERISSLAENGSKNQCGSVYFVTDQGTYFNEAINSGTEPPPIDVAELKALVTPIALGHSDYSHVARKKSALGIFRLNSFKTLEGGGIQVLVMANRDWVEREAKLAYAMDIGFPICLGALFFLSAGISWNGARLSTQRSQLKYAENSERRMATIIEESEDAIIVEKVDGTVGYWNPGAERLFGYSAAEMHNKPVQLLVPDKCRSVKEHLVKRLLEGQRIRQFETVRLAKDGTELDVSITASVLRNDEGEVIGFSKIVRDIRSFKAAEAELDLARRTAEDANQSKSEFLANMSHEIRTPMTAILGFADVLDTDGDFCVNPSFARGAIQTIRSNANHLLTIINDILDMSKIDAGKMTVERIEVSPTTIVDEVASLMQPQAVGKGIYVEIQYDSTVPTKIKSDPTRLRQILLNLVGNAIKFTEVGKVTLHTRYLPECNSLQFRVVDSGLGMSEEQRKLIARFGAFSQADNSTTRRFGGTGLGLRISSSLAKMLGGSIQVESELGKGSVFTVTVDAGNIEGIELIRPEASPLAKSSETKPVVASVQPQPNALPLAGLRILLAEDGPDNQRLISFHLKKAGAEVTIAENGLLAAEIIESNVHPFDLVFMDMQMPELDGYGATKRLRDGGYKLPILALTAHAMDSDRQKCLDAGCDDYTTKPISRQSLIEMAERYGKGIGKTAPLPSANPAQLVHCEMLP
jgi:PAS domain S-box-containing protein